jgi:N-acetylglutamate synthase-like GNAT family acetyltransferase
VKILVRTAETKDCESISVLVGQLGYMPAKDIIQKRLTEILASDDNYVCVACENKKIIGCIHGFYTRRIESDPFIEIGGMVVDESYRKRGVGKLLIEEILRWSDLKECSKTRVRCNIVRKETHIFYKKIGFTVCKKQVIFDKNPHEIS